MFFRLDLAAAWENVGEVKSAVSASGFNCNLWCHRCRAVVVWCESTSDFSLVENLFLLNIYLSLLLFFAILRVYGFVMLLSALVNWKAFWCIARKCKIKVTEIEVFSVPFFILTNSGQKYDK